ncbi:integrase [Pseudomonas syringae pv. pisi]|nr:integrase [Pseudomonas syringae pv. pisi]
MATLEKIRYTPYRIEISGNTVNRTATTTKSKIDVLPQIVWSDSTPWREVNLWALDQASKGKDIKTITSGMSHLHAYAKWLESQDVKWWDFPARESDRCLVRYRGDLVSARNSGELAPSTTSQRMNAVIRFYRWLGACRLLSPEWPMWRDKQVGVRLVDSFGFSRTMTVTSTDLTIPNRKAPGETLEDGLLPLPIRDARLVIDFAKTHASYELYLMLKLGFGTGMRIGTICDLKVATIQRAVPDPQFPGFNKISVGPGAHPPVHTKFGVTGQVWVSDSDLALLRKYVFSARRLKRQSKAAQGNRDTILLTRFGLPFGNGDGNASRGISVQFGRLRKDGVASGIGAFQHFRFHQSRCTFATELARTAMQVASVSMAIQIVREALLHKSEKTTLTYIRFIEKAVPMAEMANAFTRDFLGIADTGAPKSEQCL